MCVGLDRLNRAASTTCWPSLGRDYVVTYCRAGRCPPEAAPGKEELVVSIAHFTIGPSQVVASRRAQKA